MNDPQVKSTDERILEAASRLFADRGFEPVSVEDVARAAGVSRATVFNRFGSKRGLVETLTAGVLASYADLLKAALADRRTPFDAQILALLGHMAGGIEAGRSYYRLIFQEIAKQSVGIEEGGPGARVRVEAVNMLELLVTRGQARRQVDATLDARDVGLMFDSLVFGTVTHWLFGGGEESLSDAMERMGRLFLHAVEAGDESSVRVVRPKSAEDAP